MPIIKPASALRNNYPEISKIARESGQPIFLTKNGTGDMVLLSIEEYEEKIERLELYEKLAEGEDDLKAGRIKTLDEVSALMKVAINKHEKVRNEI